jgi:Winged helix-turn-helix DNA-binding
MKTIEQRLLRAMRDKPSMSVVGLANVAGSSRSATGERLRQLAERGVGEGRCWTMAAGGEKAIASPGTEADPTVAPPN